MLPRPGRFSRNHPNLIYLPNVRTYALVKVLSMAIGNSVGLVRPLTLYLLSSIPRQNLSKHSPTVVDLKSAASYFPGNVSFILLKQMESSCIPENAASPSSPPSLPPPPTSGTQKARRNAAKGGNRFHKTVGYKERGRAVLQSLVPRSFCAYRDVRTDSVV